MKSAILYLNNFPLAKSLDTVFKKISGSDFMSTSMNHRAVTAIYIVLTVSFAVITAVLCQVFLSSSFVYWIKALQLFLFLFAGIVNLLLLNRLLTSLRIEKPGKQLAFSVMLALCTCLTLFVFYFVTDSGLYIMAFSCSCAFLLPSFTQHTYASFESIRSVQPKLWYVDTTTDDTVSIYLNSTRIKLQLLQNSGTAHTVHDMIVPAQTSFGKWFSRFVSEQNEAAQKSINNNRKSTDGWYFYTIVAGGLYKRYLDPSISISENGVRENARVFAVRVSGAATN